MFRLRAVLAALLLGAPFTASAADITRLASSFDEDDPFDLFIDVGFSRTQNRSKIIRERLASEGGDKAEVWFRGSDSRLNIDLSLGLYKDLQFSFSLPLVLAQNDNYTYVLGTDETNSTINNNCINPNGTLTSPTCTSTGAGESNLFGSMGDAGITSKRGGLGNMRFGLAYAFFNQKTDSSKPDWIVGLDYEAPTAAQRDPSIDNALLGSERGNVGDRVHKYTFYTALSRRIGVAEPYFKAHYTLPVAGPGIYSNCFNPDTLGRPENCFAPGTPWNRKETGIQSPHMAGFLVGSEFLAFNDTTKKQQFALDLRAIGNYVGRGRYYNELSAAMRKLLATQDYFQVGGQLGVTASAGSAFKLRASGTFFYNTDHTLTDEVIGKDSDDAGEDIDVTTNPREVNPNFDFRTDLVSRRFRAAESKTLRLDVMASFMF